jgi:hypothetical protein
MAAIVEDFLVQVNTSAAALAIDPAGLLTPHPGAFVAVQNINTAIDATVYVSDAATDANGKWIMSAVTVPTGTYKQAWGTSALEASSNLLAGINIVRVDFQVHADPERFKETAAGLFGFGTSTPAGAINDVTFFSNLYVRGGKPWYDVRTYGALGNGVANDTAALQSALDTCRLAGGGVVYLPPGVYLVQMPVAGGYALGVGTNTVVIGAGRDATIIRLTPTPNGDTQNAISNYLAGGPGNDEKISFQDFTLDGQAGLQTVANCINGISINQARAVKFLRVRVLNSYGTSVTGPGEGSSFRIQGCTDVSLVDCEAIGTVPFTTMKTADGFTCGSGSTHVSLVNCTAYGLHGIGIAIGGAHGVLIGCRSFLNRNHGYNNEGVNETTYIGCRAGGLAWATASYPFTAGQNLGNGGNGFTFGGALGNQRITLIGCIARNNGTTFTGTAGLFANSNSQIRIYGGDFSNHINTNCLGLLFQDPPSAQNSRLVGVTATGNAVAAMQSGGAPNVNGPIAGLQVAPVIGASPFTFTWPWPVDGTIHITGGTVSAIALDGNATGLTAGTFRMQAGRASTITLTFTGAPSWTMFLDG